VDSSNSDSEEDSPPAPGAPDFVHAVSRLSTVLDSLSRLLQSSTPPQRLIRPQHATTCMYGFADTSSTGFRSTLHLPTGTVTYRYDLWGRDADAETSNFRELCNLVKTLEADVASGALVGSEVFLFTDNSTAESIYYKGSSTSKTWFNLILRLRQIDMDGRIVLHVIHVAGSWMISQGTNGLSRGDFTTGVMTVTPMLSFIPLHLTAHDREPLLLPWIRSWAPSPDLASLPPSHWYREGHALRGGALNSKGLWIPHLGSNTWYLWCPPPTAAFPALQELGISRHKLPHLGHLFICPRLFTHRWHKVLYKLADMVVELPAGCRPFWALHHHEPLLIGFLLPFSCSYPWQHRQSERVLAVVGQLSSMWKSPDQDERSLLCQLCALT